MKIKYINKQNRKTAVSVAIVLVILVTILLAVFFRKPKISLFENIQVTFAGISPDAYVLVQNNWEDEFLGSLHFTADKTAGIVKDDVITVTCHVTESELKEHGLRAEALTATYKADQLNAFTESAEEIDKELLSEITKQCINTITAQTADTTFRMFYKATKDPAYLREVNNERADNIQLLNTYFFSRKNDLEASADNYLFLVFKADVINDNISMPVYFVFTYTDGYITPDGAYEINYDNPEERYQCSADYEWLNSNAIEIYDDIYNVTEITQQP
ncbi:MAG: hypothetical protein Q4F11_07590 [Eubacteriales bacterium]|nr:hypothetical protein [Eubacteriales bacterium]